ncbi:MAG: DUF4037 domain-containing protein [Caldilineaceae bacterium]
MTRSIIDISREFFEQIVKPVTWKSISPPKPRRAAFGGLWAGFRRWAWMTGVFARPPFRAAHRCRMPATVFAQKREAIAQTLAANLQTFRGHSLRHGHVAGAGLAPDTLSALLKRSVGLKRAPQSYAEWLSCPEEDIIHVINGEVWHDPLGEFTAVRQTFLNYYPEPVRLRRIAHWCRYFSGMGTYALKRAILRNNDYYAATRFALALRLGIQLAFLLDKQYAPYDKWIMAYFARFAPFIHAAATHCG